MATETRIEPAPDFHAEKHDLAWLPDTDDVGSYSSICRLQVGDDCLANTHAILLLGGSDAVGECKHKRPRVALLRRPAVDVGQEHCVRVRMREILSPS